MHRRQWLKATLSASAAGVPDAVGVGAPAGGHGLPPLKITDVRTILTAPAGIRLVVVKVHTSEPGLYGLGCATFTQRARVVETAVQRYLKPFLLGKDPLRIEDIWQSSFVSSYWRNGPVLGNALSGVDWRTRSARRTWATSPTCGSRRARRWPWASCSTTPTSGCRW
jgi:hypothetical protein